MSESIAAQVDPQDAVEPFEHVEEAVRPPPVVITEREVAFSTAATMSAPRVKRAHSVIAALRGLFVSQPQESRVPKPRGGYPPLRDPCFEEAATAREMHRL